MEADRDRKGKGRRTLREKSIYEPTNTMSTCNAVFEFELFECWNEPPALL